MQHMDTDTDFLLDTLEVAQALGVTPQHVRRLRVIDGGPVYQKDSTGRVTYLWSQVEGYAEKNNKRLRWPGEQQ